MSLAFIDERLEKRREKGLLRSLPSAERLIDLTSNDYFGFAKKREALKEGTHSGSTGSRLLTGNHPDYEELEEQIRRFHRSESALIYNSGYCANLGLLSSIGVDGATFIYDLEIHASMVDGMRLSSAQRVPFRHNDLDSLEKRLKNVSLPAFVLIESIYSLSGDVAPLEPISSLCAQYGAHLIVDEAHATGIYGKRGEGLTVELGLEERVFARIHTFSKALGAHGASVLGSRKLKEYLVNFSRPFIYTTALSSSSIDLIRSKYERLEREVSHDQKRLRELISYFCRQVGGDRGRTPIQPLYIPDVARLRSLSEKLKGKHLDVRPILPPTAHRGEECLRVVLHSFNREEEIDLLIEELK